MKIEEIYTEETQKQLDKIDEMICEILKSYLKKINKLLESSFDRKDEIANIRLEMIEDMRFKFLKSQKAEIISRSCPKYRYIAETPEEKELFKNIFNKEVIDT